MKARLMRSAAASCSEAGNPVSRTDTASCETLNPAELISVRSAEALLVQKTLFFIDNISVRQLWTPFVQLRCF